VKKALNWFAAAVLLTILAVPTILMGEDPEPPCPNCKPPLTLVQK